MGQEAVTDDVLSEVPTDALVMIAGPPLTGKYELLLDLLRLRAERVLFITTKNGYERVRSDFDAIAGPVEEDRLGIVDCVSYNQSLDVGQVSGPVVFAKSPENLTRIGVKFTGLADEFTERGGEGQIGVGVHSLSQLLMHSDLKKLYQFLQVLTGQVRNAGWFGAAVIDLDGEDNEGYQKLYHHFDGVVETRENDDGSRELRVRGFGPRTTEWTPF